MQRSPSIANLSQTPSSSRGGDPSWYDDMLLHLSQQPTWPSDKESAILEPYSYLDSNPGKEVRSKLIEAFNVWLQVPNEKLDVIRRIVRMLHTASLLMDDVEDNSDLRRGIPVAHKIYGVPQTINTANYVYFLVFQELFGLGGQTASIQRLIVEELVNLHRGQGMDLLWRDSLICPTEQEYVEMVNNKTGGLFRIAIQLMISQSPVMDLGFPDLIPLVNLIGLHFQIRDDYMNLQSSKYAENKGFCEDLTEGKFSFPIIHSIRTSCRVESSQFGGKMGTELGHSERGMSGNIGRGNRQMLNVLKQRPTDLATKQYAVSYMRNVTKSFQYTRDVLIRLDRQARTEVGRIESLQGQNPSLFAILDALREGWYTDTDTVSSVNLN